MFWLLNFLWFASSTEKDDVSKMVIFRDTNNNSNFENIYIDNWDINYISKSLENCKSCNFFSNHIIEILGLLEKYKEEFLIGKFDQILIESRGLNLLKIIQKNNNSGKSIMVDIQDYRRIFNK